ncbi:unnamed protein product [Leuciscus chuanchicus]
MSRKICQIQCFSTEALTPRIITPGKPRNSPLNQCAKTQRRERGLIRISKGGRDRRSVCVGEREVLHVVERQEGTERDPKCYLMIFIIHCSSSSSPIHTSIPVGLQSSSDSFSLSVFSQVGYDDGFFGGDDEKPLSVLVFAPLQAI